MGDGGGGHWLVQIEWHPAGRSVCLPLLIFPCTIKSRSSLLAPAHPGGPGKRAVKWLWFSVVISGRAWSPEREEVLLSTCLAYCPMNSVKAVKATQITGNHPTSLVLLDPSTTEGMNTAICQQWHCQLSEDSAWLQCQYPIKTTAKTAKLLRHNDYILAVI